MNFIKTGIQGLTIIKPHVYTDSRGYFYEAFREHEFIKNGINEKFVQDNVSRSIRNTVRGLHYQIGDYAQGKLCQVFYGRVLDVAVDIRFGSPTFGKYHAVELSDENKKMFWISPGFAHGFSVLSDWAVFYYKCTGYYNKESERTIYSLDPDLKIDWKVTNPILSDKDRNGELIKNIKKDFFHNTDEYLEE